VLDLASAAETEIIQKSGTWYTYGNERLGQGRENAKDYLREHPETMAKIELALRTKANLLKAASNGKDESDEVKALPSTAPATAENIVTEKEKANQKKPVVGASVGR